MNNVLSNLLKMENLSNVALIADLLRNLESFATSLKKQQGMIANIEAILTSKPYVCYQETQTDSEVFDDGPLQDWSAGKKPKDQGPATVQRWTGEPCRLGSMTRRTPGALGIGLNAKNIPDFGGAGDAPVKMEFSKVNDTLGSWTWQSQAETASEVNRRLKRLRSSTPDVKNPEAGTPIPAPDFRNPIVKNQEADGRNPDSDVPKPVEVPKAVLVTKCHSKSPGSDSEVSVDVFAKMKSTVEAFLGKDVTHSVVIVPASFSSEQQQELEDAGNSAGLDFVVVADDPIVAVSLGYIHDEDQQNTMAFTFRGGKIKVTMMAIQPLQNPAVKNPKLEPDASNLAIGIPNKDPEVPKSSLETPKKAVEPPKSVLEIPKAVEPPKSVMETPKAVEPPKSVLEIPKAVEPPKSVLEIPKSPLVTKTQNKPRGSESEISIDVLAKMKDTAEVYLGKEVTHSVVIVPTKFSPEQREELEYAGIAAGLDTLLVDDEPILAYSLNCAHDEEGDFTLTFDLQGKFKVSLMAIHKSQ